jgi:lysophospholipase L1-like esterase
VKRLRKDLKAPAVPFLAGGMSDPLMARNQHARTVDQALRALPREVPHTAYVSAEGLKLKADNVHFNAAGYRELGRRYAKQLLELRSTSPEKPTRKK